jgi:hypothetical protein
MGITYHIDLQQRILFTQMAGIVTDADLPAYVTAVWALPGRAQCDQLIDTRAVTRWAVTSAGLRQADILGDHLNRDRMPSRTAIVAPLDVAYGMGRMIEMYRIHTLVTIQVFRIYADALAWLQLPAAPASPDTPS